MCGMRPVSNPGPAPFVYHEPQRRAEAAAVSAVASGSQHKTIKAITPRSLSVSVPMGTGAQFERPPFLRVDA